MKTPGIARRARGVLFALPLLLLLAGVTASWAAGEYRNAAEGILSMRYAEGRLSLETRDASLSKVLQELSRIADLRIVSDGPLEDRVTVYADGLDLDAAARKILRGKDSTFIYRPPDPGSPPGPYRLEEIRVFVSEGTPGQAQTFSYNRTDEDQRQELEERRAEIRERNARLAEERARARAVHDPTPRDDAGSETDQFLSGLLGGNLEALDEVADRLREQHPEAREQIDQFLETLEAAKARAAESGGQAPPMEGMENMGAIMQQILDGQSR